MPCGCKHSKESEKAYMGPIGQCLFCGQKHLVTAWALWTEAGYRELQLQAIHGQLRLSVFHLMDIQPELSEEIRQLAKDIQAHTGPEGIEERFEKAMLKLQDIIYAEHPEMKQCNK